MEKLAAPIALYPDALIATLLPASVYPLEIVQAARFVADTNNLAKLDAQPWDENVKAVARMPGVIKQMNDDLTWTMDLGEAFLTQDKELMDTIQDLRGKAQKVGNLRTTPQQVVTVTNMVVEKTVEHQVVVVTNTIIQIQPANPSVIYVPTYNPYSVYYPPPYYVYNPYAPVVTFAAGVAVGAIIANNCNWYRGGCYHGNVNININNNYNYNKNNNININRNGNANGSQQKWQPDQNRLSKSGAPGVANTAASREARGYGSGGAGPAAGSAGARPATGTAGTRPSTGSAGAGPSTGAAGARPSTGGVGTRPSTGTASANAPTASGGANRPSSSPGASQNRSGSSAARSSSSGSAFGVSNGASARSSSNRGSSSLGSGGGGARGGGARSGGGRR